MHRPKFVNLEVTINVLKRRVGTQKMKAGNINLQATKLFIVTSATKEEVVTTPLDIVFRSKYCIV